MNHGTNGAVETAAPVAQAIVPLDHVPVAVPGFMMMLVAVDPARVVYVPLSVPVPPVNPVRVTPQPTNCPAIAAGPEVGAVKPVPSVTVIEAVGLDPVTVADPL